MERHSELRPDQQAHTARSLHHPLKNAFECHVLGGPVGCNPDERAAPAGGILTLVEEATAGAAAIAGAG